MEMMMATMKKLSLGSLLILVMYFYWETEAISHLMGEVCVRLK